MKSFKNLDAGEKCWKRVLERRVVEKNRGGLEEIVGEECCREILKGSVGGDCWRSMVEKSVGKKSCRGMLGGSVDKCWRKVL